VAAQAKQALPFEEPSRTVRPNPAELTAAVKVEDRVFSGRLSEHHFDVTERATEELGEAKYARLFREGKVVEGFTDANGKFYNTKEIHEIFGVSSTEEIRVLGRAGFRGGLRAAVQIGERNFEGLIHADARDAALEALGQQEFARRSAAKEIREGFLDENNNFLTRQEARRDRGIETSEELLVRRVREADTEDIRVGADRARIEVEEGKHVDRIVDRLESHPSIPREEIVKRLTEIDDAIPGEVESLVLSYAAGNEVEAANRVIAKLDSSPQIRSAMIENLRRNFGERIAVYRAGDIIADRPQSWSMIPDVAREFSRFGNRDIIRGEVPVDKVLFTGLTRDGELVLRARDVEVAGRFAPPDFVVRFSSLLEARSNLAEAIINQFARLPEKQVAVIPGVDTPGASLAVARQLIGEDMIVGVYKRPDGQFDVAIGRPGSLLERGRKQFNSQGYITGMEVSLNGKPYRYQDALAGDRARITDLGTNKMLEVPRSELRRTSEVREVQANVERNRRLLEEALEPEELSAFDKLVERVLVENQRPIETESKAASNGQYVERDNAGGWLVRDTETGEIQFRANNEADVRAYIDRSGQREAPDLLGGSDVPPEIPGSVSLPPSQPPRMNEPFPLPRGPVGKLVDLLNTTVFRRFTPMRDLFQSFDNLLGTNLVRDVYGPTQDVMLKSWGLSEPFLRRLEKFDTETAQKLSAERRRIVSDYREAMSANEILTKLFKNRPLTQREINLAEILVADKIDTSRIYKYVRARDSMLELRAREEGVEVGNLPPEIRQEVVTQARRDFRMTDAEMNAAGIFDMVKKLDLEEVALYAVTRLANARMSNTLSRAEFAAKHKMTAKEVGLANNLDKLYEDLAEAFGIDDARLIEGYMNHYRSQSAHGALTSEAAFLWQNRVGGELPPARKFLSEMVRSGELSSFERDPILSAFRYINSGFRAQEVLPVWREAYRNATDQLQRAGETLIPRLISPLKGVETPLKITRGYLHELLGYPDENVATTQLMFDRYFDALGIKMDVNVRKNLVNTWLATVNSAALGFRPAMGLRDMAQFFTMYGSRFGFPRATNGLVMALKPGMAAELRNSGVLPQMSIVEFSTPQELARSTFGQKVGKLPNTLNKIAEAGLTYSGQKNAYEIMHAAAYLDTRQHVLSELGKFVRDAIPKDKAYRNIKLATFDNGVQDAFNRLVDAGEIDKAADFLGKNAGRDVAFVYGMANHPYGWGTNIGRVSMQFGTWSVWARGYLARGLTQGTRAQRVAFATRMAMAQTALGIAGAGLGLNLYSWFLLPGLIFAGGPLVQSMMLVGNLTSPFQIDRAIAKSRLARNLPINDIRSLFIPGSYAMGDLYRAFTEAENPTEFFARGIGIPLARGRSSSEDLFK
jgi:hypothetical protein